MVLHEVLVFTPEKGEFDVAGVEGFLSSLPFTFRDPGGPWLLCGNPGATQFSRLRLLEPGADYPYMCLVRVEPEKVRITQVCDDDALAQAREVAEWLHEHYPSCRIATDEGRDLTALARESVVPLYEG